MQRGRGGRDDFFGFGDPFAGFGGFGRPGSLIPSFFGGRDPFDDPFFTRPFGSLMGPSMFGPSIFDDGRSFFGETSNAGFLEQAPPPQSKGPIIEELSSDDEEGDGERTDKEKKNNPRKHSRSSKEPYVQDPDEETEEKKSKYMQYSNEFGRAGASQPQARAYSFQSSTVTYGGPNGAYYTSSTTRRTGGDGVTMEEQKEADTTTRRATHRVSRGIHDKGHSVTRKLNSDGRVDTMQTLHNLNENDLAGFEEAWKGKARQHLPGWNPGLDMLDNGSARNGSSSRQGERPARGWALPSAEQPYDSGRMRAQPQTDSFRRGAR
ncbi:myeloid leukemia factor 1 [Cocos nucifera]|uniref:Myeloid leukemia factor 1 n=1 Tax=Cocos nucifera TaxID=13894 RepID=A0A8K0IKT7_COCNU|nr:myeloid leukemia factor 1 [Cocos nucifera]